MRFTMYTVSPCIRYAVLFNTAHVVFQYVFFIQKKSCNEKFKLPIIKTRPAVLSLVFFSWWVTQSVALVVWTRYHHNHHHRRRVAGEGRRVVHTPACPRLSDTLMWSWRAMFAGVPSSSRATYANTEMRRRDRRWDSEVRPVHCSTSSIRTRSYHRISSSCPRHFWWKAFLTSADSKVQVSAAYSNTTVVPAFQRKTM